MQIGRLLLRTTLGGFFVGHGTQKLFGWFGGSGPDGTAAMFEKLGLRPGRHHALAAGIAEAGGGAAIVAGAATPLAASTLTATMLTAIHRVHFKNGPWVTKGGYEYNAVLIAAAIMLAEVGPGTFSVDARLGDHLHGRGWAIAALAGGIAGAAGAHLYAESKSAFSAPSPTTGGPQAAEMSATEVSTEPEPQPVR
jgi:putative oxidoreductase